MSRIGYSDAEISQVFVARDVEVLEKARRYDDIVSKEQKGPPPIPRLRGSKPPSPSKLEETRARAKNTGSVYDALDYLNAKREAQR